MSKQPDCDSASIGDSLLIVVFSFVYISGIVLANGWYKLLAIFFPPYSMYLLCKHFLT